MMQKKVEDLGTSTSWKKVWYLKEPKEMDYEGRWLADLSA